MRPVEDPELLAQLEGPQNFGQGNIDLNRRPVVHNEDGSISTVRSMSFNDGQSEILIPTVSNDGRTLTPEQAIDTYRSSGQFLGKFKTPTEATRYAEKLHNDQAAQYAPRPVTDLDILKLLEGAPEGVAMRGPRADVPTYLRSDMAPPMALGPFGAGGLTEKFIRGDAGGLNRMGEGIAQTATQLTGGDPKEAARNIQGIDTGIAEQGPAGKVGAVAGENALLAVGPAGVLPAASAAFIQGSTRADPTGDVTLKQRVGQGATEAVVTAAAGGTVKAFNKGLNWYSHVDKARPTADSIRDLASAAYQKADEVGGTLSGRVTNQFVDEAQKKLAAQTPAGKLVVGETIATKLAERLKSLKGKRLSLAEAQEIDEFLGDTIDGLTDAGRLTKEGRRLYDLQSAFREIVDKAPPKDLVGGAEGFKALREGRRLWAMQAQLRDIEKVLARADSAEQPASAIKNGFAAIVANPARLRSFPPGVQEQIKKAAKTGVVTDALRFGGSRLWGIVGGATGGVGGAIGAYAASTGSRGLASRIQADKALKVADEITGFKPTPTASASPMLSGSLGASSGAATGGLSRSEMPTTNRIFERARQPLQLPNEQFRTTPRQRAIRDTLSNLVTVQFGSANGTSPTFMSKLVGAESGGKTDAKAKTSSAVGVAQITIPTWVHLIENYRPELMVGKSYREILNLRKDPELSAEMAGHYAEENKKILSDQGIPVTDTTVYLAHFLGPQQASKLLKAKIGTPVSAVVSAEAIRANPTVLQGKKAEQVLRWAQAKMKERK